MERFNFLNAKVTLREFVLVLVALALFFLSLFISKGKIDRFRPTRLDKTRHW